MAFGNFVKDVFVGRAKTPPVSRMGVDFVLTPNGVRGTGINGSGICHPIFGNHTISAVNLLNDKGKVVHTSHLQHGNVCANQGDKLEIALNYNFV